VPEYCGDTAFGEIDFGGYAAGVLDELEGKWNDFWLLIQTLYSTGVGQR
jgi:hypothetical protein